MIKRLLLLDDHPVMREGYRSLLRSEPGLEVCGEAGSAEEAFQMAQEMDFDAAIVDLSLPGANGVEFIKRLIAVDPAAKVLVVSAHDEDLYAERALQAGARGYLMKYGSAERFIDAIQTVLEGNLYLSESLRSRFIQGRLGLAPLASADMSALTDRELEVFEHFGRGKGTREVAEAMDLSVKTIESHRANIKRKLGLESAAEFAQRAVLWVESPFLSGGGA